MDEAERTAIVEELVSRFGYSFDQGHGRAAGTACDIVRQHLFEMEAALDRHPHTRMRDTGEAA